MVEHWKSDLESWLTPFLGALGLKVRARMCPTFVAGVIGACDRKSVQPMAARDCGVGYDQLHHFIAGGAWEQRLWRRSCSPRPTGWSAAARPG